LINFRNSGRWASTGVRVHDLRHSAATALLEQGKPAKLVPEILGHATTTLTLDTYSHITPAMHADAAAAVDALFAKKQSS
jgi:integrase